MPPVTEARRKDNVPHVRRSQNLFTSLQPILPDLAWLSDRMSRFLLCAIVLGMVSADISIHNGLSGTQQSSVEHVIRPVFDTLCSSLRACTELEIEEDEAQELNITWRVSERCGCEMISPRAKMIGCVP